MIVAPVILEGSKIRLIPLSHGHVGALCDVGLEPKLWAATTIQVLTLADMKAYVSAALQAQAEKTALPFVIVERSSGLVIGCTRFHTIVPEPRRLEVGFSWIALPQQRTFVNTETKYLLLKHAFESLGCLRVEFRTDAENEQSRRALERIGARLEGILRSYRVTAHKGVRDLALFSIISTEWPELRAALEKKLRAD